ncbi:hypothetical protein EDD15DRAFT_2152009, partial [Pisolithus albus]
ALPAYSEFNIAQDRTLAKGAQQELARPSLRTATAVTEIWYIPTLLCQFVESFFAIPDKEMESRIHLQSRML